MGLFDWFKRKVRGTPQAPPPGSARFDASSRAGADRSFAGNTFSVGPMPDSSPSGPVRTPPSSQSPQGRKLDLTASQFTPLSDDDIRKQARGLGPAWANPVFGRRDRIPPASDPRTNLIDRALVAHGLLSIENLKTIHEVGQRMDELRPDLALAGHQANLAVQRSREDHALLKERKKTEAAERRRKHGEAVARRKATDIIYLGRGVSAGLADRRADVEKLHSLNLPVLATPSDVAQALGITIPRLRWLAFHAEAATRTHYVCFTIPKRSGGVRRLFAPHEQLAASQEWILTNVLEKVPVHDAAHGFLIGRSTVTNATPHVGKKVLINADLRDFFPTINVHRLIGVFKSLGYSPAVATILALLCTEAPRRTVAYAGTTYHVATGQRSLPQGACTSPALSNLVSRRLDARLSGISRKLGWTYTRYADDLTFSTDADERVGYLLARLRHIALDESFAVNEDKTRVQRRHHAMTVTGVVVNDRTGIDRTLVRRLRAILHQARTAGLPAQNHEKIPHFESWVRGMIAYVRMVNPAQGDRLHSDFKRLPK